MKPFAFLLVPVLAGCLSSAPKSPVNWTLEFKPASRVAQVVVCAPYGGTRLAVLRPNGSIAFDAFNAFAATPAAIIGDACASRRARGSLIVRKLALDCREEGRRDALVELDLSLEDGGPRGHGSAAVPTDDGNYTAAFSSALQQAYDEALEGLKAK